MSRNLGFKTVTDGDYYFISYNSNDEATVSQYAGALNNAGIRMWYDDGLEIGEAWETQIADRIEGCRAIIMFLSKNIFKRENSYVRKEYKLAHHFKKKIYVILVDEIKEEDIPNHFIGWWMDITEYHLVQAYMFSDVNEFADKIADLIDPSVKLVNKETKPKEKTTEKAEHIPEKVEHIPEKAEHVQKTDNGNDDLISTVNKLISKYNISRIKYYTPDDNAFRKKINKAIAEYAPVTSTETVLLMEDATLMGSAKEGFVLTDKNIYFNNMSVKKKSYPINDVLEIKSANPGLGMMDICIVTTEGEFKISYTFNKEIAQYISFFRELFEYIKL